MNNCDPTDEWPKPRPRPKTIQGQKVEEMVEAVETLVEVLSGFFNELNHYRDYLIASYDESCEIDGIEIANRTWAPALSAFERIMTRAPDRPFKGV